MAVFGVLTPALEEPKVPVPTWIAHQAELLRDAARRGVPAADAFLRFAGLVPEHPGGGVGGVRLPEALRAFRQRLSSFALLPGAAWGEVRSFLYRERGHPVSGRLQCLGALEHASGRGVVQVRGAEVQRSGRLVYRRGIVLLTGKRGADVVSEPLHELEILGGRAMGASVVSGDDSEQATGWVKQRC